MFNIGDKFEIKISGVFVVEGGIFYAAEGIKDYLFDEDELKQLIGNSEGISVGDEVIFEDVIFYVTEIHADNIGGIDGHGNVYGCTVDECRKTGRRSEKILKLLGEMQNDKN